MLNFQGKALMRTFWLESRCTFQELTVERTLSFVSEADDLVERDVDNDVISNRTVGDTTLLAQ